ncbi:MAG TPA: tripartite tricarboxylate transporter TctB family protein [candidate division Zixibacteria bacterium]|nr:tripartite tricarboxylate transporter TctB family protein [candidate division Zixibacteria bacterium]
MNRRGHIYLSLFLIFVAGYAIHSASQWPFKAGFFPLAAAIPLLILALAHLLLQLYGKPEAAAGAAVEAEFSAEVPPEVARRRAVTIFGWMAGFIAMVYLASFPVAVPLFLFLFLKLQSRTSWRSSFVLTAITWGFFYALFQRIVHLQFESGLIQLRLGL